MNFYRLRGRPVRVNTSTGTINGVLHSATTKSVWLLVAGNDLFVPVTDIVSCEVQT